MDLDLARYYDRCIPADDDCDCNQGEGKPCPVCEEPVCAHCGVFAEDAQVFAHAHCCHATVDGYGSIYSVGKLEVEA